MIICVTEKRVIKAISLIPLDHTHANEKYFISGALQISNSQETDQGKYECVAENAVGTQHATAITLWVRGKCFFFLLFFLTIIITYRYSSFYHYIFICSAEQRPLKTQLCVKTKTSYTILKSHYFPFICCFFLFFSFSRICAHFLTFILNVIYDSDLQTRTGKRDQTNL